MAKSILGKPKDDDIVKEAAKESVAKAVKKKYPLVPKWAVKKGLDKAEKNAKKRGLGL